MKHILITGINGFVGTNLAPFLANQFKVEGLSLRDGVPNNLEIQADTVIHLAGLAHDLKKSSQTDLYYTVNYEYTKALFDAFIASKATCFIYISSVKAAADTVEGNLTEEIQPRPITDYGKSKLKAENYILNYPLPEGKRFYILRPCMIHGPGNKGNLNLLFQFAKRGIPYPLGAFNNKRSFLSIDNLNFIIENLIKKEAPSGVYNVSDDEPLSTVEVVKILSSAVGKQPKIWNLSTKLIKLISKIGGILKLPLNEERLEKLTENFVVDNSKIKKALQVNLPLTAAAGMLKTAQSFTTKS